MMTDHNTTKLNKVSHIEQIVIEPYIQMYIQWGLSISLAL
jgi:hypothetical protein